MIFASFSTRKNTKLAPVVFSPLPSVLFIPLLLLSSLTLACFSLEYAVENSENSHVSPHTCDEERDVSELQQWLRANGVKNVGEYDDPMKVVVNHETRVGPADMTGGNSEKLSGLKTTRADLSVVAGRNVSLGERILSIPFSLLIASFDLSESADVDQSKRSKFAADHPYKDSILEELREAEKEERGKEEGESKRGTEGEKEGEKDGEGERERKREESSSRSSVGTWATYSLFSARLLREKAKGEGSFWHPYMKVLPQYVPIPTLWKDELLLETQHNIFIDTVRSYRSTYELEYEKCDPLKIGNATKDEFFWALSIVTSRCFSADSPAPPSIPVESLSPSLAANEWEREVERNREKERLEEERRRISGGMLMAPFVDLMNHDFYSYTTWHFENGTFHVTATSEIPEGSPIYTSYGPKPTDEFLLSYGFVPSQNPFDNFVLFPTSTHVYEYFFDAHFTRLGEKMSKNDEQWMDSVADKVQDTIISTSELPEFSHFVGPEYGFEPTYSQGAAVWPNGHVDPRMMGVLAAVWYLYTFKMEPDYQAISYASLVLSWDVFETTCSDMMVEAKKNEAASEGEEGEAAKEREGETEEMTGRKREAEREEFGGSEIFPKSLDENHVRAIIGASQLLRVRVREFLNSFSTTWEEDIVNLNELLECKRDKGKDESKTRCEQVFHGMMGDLTELELALRFRIEKKSLLRQVDSRLAWICDPDLEPYHQAVDEGEGDGNDSNAGEYLDAKVDAKSRKRLPKAYSRHDEL